MHLRWLRIWRRLVRDIRRARARAALRLARDLQVDKAWFAPLLQDVLYPRLGSPPADWW